MNLDTLFPIVYDELRVLAHARLRHNNPGEALNTTALVHEAYIKLTAGETPSIADRAHFFALAARAMRFVLVSYARERGAQKRGGGVANVTLDEDLAIPLNSADAEAADLLTLDAALEKLTSASKRLSEVVELRFFGGLSYEEIAEVTGRSEATIKRDWRRARAWLYEMMQEDGRADDTEPDDTEPDDTGPDDSAIEG